MLLGGELANVILRREMVVWKNSYLRSSSSEQSQQGTQAGHKKEKGRGWVK